MPRVIYKYPFKIDDTFDVDAPPGPVRQVAVQPTSYVEGQGYLPDIPCLWIEHELDAPRESRRFRVIGTGQPILEPQDERLDFVGTFFHARFVWHVYEQI